MAGMNRYSAMVPRDPEPMTNSRLPPFTLRPISGLCDRICNASMISAMRAGASCDANCAYDGYFSEAEKLANAKTILEQSFADIDLDMPDTRAEFRALVESLDLTTESGQETFAAMMRLQSGFGQVADAAQAAADAAIQQAEQQAAATASLRS